METPKWADKKDNGILEKILEKNDKPEISCLALGSNLHCSKTLTLIKLNGNHNVTMSFTSYVPSITKEHGKRSFTYTMATLVFRYPQQKHAGLYRCIRKVCHCKEDTWTHADVLVKFIGKYKHR